MSPTTPMTSEFARDVRDGLSLRPKQLYSKYLYDALGSHLFEAVCHLPWYPITRAENRLLSSFAQQMVGSVTDPAMLVELGCGSGEKIAIVADALRGRGSSVMVHLIDISRTALEQSERTLGRLPHVSVVGHRATYEAGLRRAADLRTDDGTMLVLFLGSNIGNFDLPARQEFMREIRGCLRPGDGLLMGADLIKPEGDMLLAYDDPLGVTAAFDKNLLVRINRELGGTFDLNTFEHRAKWNTEASRMEMHLVSKQTQLVRVEACQAEFGFVRDESIWTESSYKFTPEVVREMGEQAGFRCRERWIDSESRFLATVFVAA